MPIILSSAAASAAAFWRSLAAAWAALAAAFSAIISALVGSFFAGVESADDPLDDGL